MPEENTILGGETAASGVTGEQQITGNAEQQEVKVTEQAFDYGKMIGAEGALADNWREGLPENIRGEKCLDSIKTIGTLAQSYVHAQRAIGANKVAIPGDNSTPEEWNEFYKACGRPDKEDEYKSDGVKLPEGIVLDEGQVKEFRKFAFDHGIPQKTFEAALAFDVARVEKMQQAAQAAHEAEYQETLSKLRGEFGGRFETVVAQCNKAMDTFGLTNVLREKGLLNNYTIIKALAGIGERIEESKLKGGEAQSMTNDPATRLAEIQGNPDDPYYKKEHPAHNARVAEVNGLLAAMARAKGSRKLGAGQ